jgi:ornithine cyclodeaminase/alanine dehydrogenase-like protein (mu-crystallin family)
LTGLVIQDVSVTYTVYTLAKKKKLGRMVEFF